MCIDSSMFLFWAGMFTDGYKILEPLVTVRAAVLLRFMSLFMTPQIIEPSKAFIAFWACENPFISKVALFMTPHFIIAQKFHVAYFANKRFINNFIPVIMSTFMFLEIAQVIELHVTRGAFENYL